MAKPIIFIFINLLFFQFTATSKHSNEIEIYVIDVLTGKAVDFKYELSVEFKDTKIQCSQFLDRDLLLNSSDKDSVQLKLEIVDYDFEWKLPILVLKEASKIIYKVSFNPLGRWRKIYYTNIYGETFIQKISGDFVLPNNYESLKILHYDYDFSGPFDGASLDWIRHADPSPRIEGRYVFGVGEDEIRMELRDSTRLKISIKNQNGLTKVVDGSWAYQEDLKVIWVVTSTPVFLKNEQKESAKINTCVFELMEENEIEINTYVEENGAIVKKGLGELKKE